MQKKKMSAGDYIECSWDIIIVLLEHEAGQKKEAGGMTKEEGRTGQVGSGLPLILCVLCKDMEILFCR